LRVRRGRSPRARPAAARNTRALLTSGTVGYLAVTEQEVALIRGKKGAFKPKVGQEVVGRVPRADVEGIEFDKGALKGDLKLQFTDGGWWEFEIPKVYRRTTEAVVKTLTP